MIGPANPVLLLRPSSRHQVYHFQLLLEQVNQSHTTARATFCTLNANGIVNTLTELGVVLERNKVKRGGDTGVNA